MRVVLRINEKGCPLRREILVVGGGRIPSLTVHVSDSVSADLEVEDGDAPGLYMIQVGNQPDIRADADFQVGESSCKFAWHKYDSELGREVSLGTFKLFQGTMGTSFLYLMRYGGDRFPIAEVAVLLDATDFRGRFYDEMVKDLLDRRLPHFVLDDFNWQMTRNQFSIGWEDGYASMESPDVMLRALKRILSRMKGPLAYINESPQMSVSKINRRMPICQVSRVNAKVTQRVGALMNRFGVDAINELSDERVCAISRQMTCNVRAHSVIFTFLKFFVRGRLDIVNDDFSERIRRQQGKLSGLQQSVSQRTCRNIYADEFAVLDSLRRKKALADRLAAIVKGLMAYDFLKHSHEELTVFDVSSDEFSSNDAYHQLYCLMLEFSRARFWWVGDRKDGVFRIPHVELGENGESRLQLKYSIVYENWCFARLVSALKKLGYACKGWETKTRDDSSAVVFANEELRFELIHGVTALARSRSISTEFVYTGGRAKKKTPDFAIVVTDVHTGRSSWVVADAKSDARLRRHIVEKRIEYATTLERDGERPLASVIFLSGEKEGDKPGVDFPPHPLEESRRDSFSHDEPLDDHSSDDYRWERENGIVEGADGVCPYHGHVRVNISSVVRADDVFCEFINGLGRTIVRMGLQKMGVIALKVRARESANQEMYLAKV